MKNLNLPLLFGSMLLIGCTNTGAFLAGNQTIVNLNEGNYSVSATNITGESEAAYIFGLSYSSGYMASTIAIARVEGTGMLYAEALENLWQNYESSHGSASNKKVALANVRYDSDILNLFFYTKVVVTVRADIVEFD
jgi:hypothetical protein